MLFLLHASCHSLVNEGKQLVQGCYAAAWVGVEPTTFQLQGRALSTEPRLVTARGRTATICVHLFGALAKAYDC